MRDEKSEVSIDHPIKPKLDTKKLQAEIDLEKLEKDTLKEIQDILRDHNNEESNIGVSADNRYWELKNQYRLLKERIVQIREK